VLRLTELFWAEQQGAFIGTAFATHVLEYTGAPFVTESSLNC
jgi:hypothetical protein